MTRPRSPSFVLLNRQRRRKIETRRLRAFLSRLARDLGVDGRDFSVVFIDDQTIRRYNRIYRGFDKPTDVLSFRGDDSYLGDILISSETARRQAEQSRTLTFDANLRRLMLHGLLHLMGYDHETDNGEMRTIERRFRRRLRC